MYVEKDLGEAYETAVVKGPDCAKECDDAASLDLLIILGDALALDVALLKIYAELSHRFVQEYLDFY